MSSIISLGPVCVLQSQNHQGYLDLHLTYVFWVNAFVLKLQTSGSPDKCMFMYFGWFFTFRFSFFLKLKSFHN